MIEKDRIAANGAKGAHRTIDAARHQLLRLLK